MPEAIATRAPKEPRNGVQTPDLLATINAVKQTPDLAKFRFRASNRWVSGTYSESRVESFTGAGGEHNHVTEFRYGVMLMRRVYDGSVENTLGFTIGLRQRI